LGTKSSCPAIAAAQTHSWHNSLKTVAPRNGRHHPHRPGQTAPGEATGFVPATDWTWLPVVELSPAEEALAANYLAIVDAGVAECVAVAVMEEWQEVVQEGLHTKEICF